MGQMMLRALALKGVMNTGLYEIGTQRGNKESYDILDKLTTEK
jgi:hypothetical protein